MQNTPSSSSASGASSVEEAFPKYSSSHHETRKHEEGGVNKVWKAEYPFFLFCFCCSLLWRRLSLSTLHFNIKRESTKKDKL